MDLDVRPDIIETIDQEKLDVMSKEEKRELFMRSRGNLCHPQQAGIRIPETASSSRSSD